MGVQENKKVVIGVGLTALAFLTFYFGYYRPQQKVMEGVSASLVDPESARFRNISIKGDYACGEVNGRNRLGGYVGYKQFYYSLDTGSLTLEGSAPQAEGIDMDGLTDGFIKMMCSP